jgi:hypothetical protein
VIAEKMPGWNPESVSVRAKNFKNRALKGKHESGRAVDAHTAFCEHLADCVAQVRVPRLHFMLSGELICAAKDSNLTMLQGPRRRLNAAHRLWDA